MLVLFIMHTGEVNSYSAKKHLGTIIIACLTAESENYMLCLIMTLFFSMHNYSCLRGCACGKINILACQDGWFHILQ